MLQSIAWYINKHRKRYKFNSVANAPANRILPQIIIEFTTQKIMLCGTRKKNGSTYWQLAQATWAFCSLAFREQHFVSYHDIRYNLCSLFFHILLSLSLSFLSRQYRVTKCNVVAWNCWHFCWETKKKLHKLLDPDMDNIGTKTI